MIEHENSEAKPEAELIEQVFSFLRQHSDAFNGSSHVFGKYFVRELLCSGKYSCVILAFDPQLRREVVLKIYRPDLTDEHKELALNEGQALSQIRCDFVAKCLAIETIGEHLVLVLEYIPGQPLSELQVPLSEALAEAVIEDVCQGVKAVHERGILHLDLKPSNIILSNDGHAILIDFGLAQPISDIRFGKISGTPNYMAPEVAAHDLSSIDTRSDVYGIGAVWLFLLTGCSPATFKNSNSIPQDGDFSEDSRFNPVLLQCLKRSPGQRYSRVNELTQSLKSNQQQSSKKSWSRLVAASLAVLILSAVIYSRFQPEELVQSLVAPDVIVQIEQQRNLSDDLIQQLPASFKIDCRLSDETVAEDTVVELQEGLQPTLDLGPHVSCYMAVFSIEYVSGIDQLQIKQLPAGSQNVFKCEGGKRTAIEIPKLVPSPEGKTEFFMIVANQKNWDVDNFVANAEQILGGGIRGTSDLPIPVAHGESIRIIPYRVSPADENAPTNSATQFSQLIAEANNIVLDQHAPIESALPYVEKAIEVSETAEQTLAQAQAIEKLMALKQAAGAIVDQQWLDTYVGNLPESYTKERVLAVAKEWLDCTPTQLQSRQYRDARSHHQRGDVLLRRMYTDAAAEEYRQAKNAYDQVFGENSLHAALVQKRSFLTAHKLERSLTKKAQIDDLESDALKMTLQGKLGSDHLEVLTIPLTYGFEYRGVRELKLALQSLDQFLQNAEAVYSNLEGDKRQELAIEIARGKRLAGQTSIYHKNEKSASQRFQECDQFIRAQTPGLHWDFKLAILEYDRFQSENHSDSSSIDIGESAYQQFERLTRSNADWLGPHVREIQWRRALSVITLALFTERQIYQDQDEGILQVKIDQSRERFEKENVTKARKQYEAAVEILQKLELTNNKQCAYGLSRIANLICKQNIVPIGSQRTPAQEKELLEAERIAREAVRVYDSIADPELSVKYVLKHTLANCLVTGGKTKEALTKFSELEPMIAALPNDYGFKMLGTLAGDFARGYLHDDQQAKAFDYFFRSAETFADITSFSDLEGIRLFDASKRLRRQLQNLITTLDESNRQQVLKAYRVFYGTKAISFGVCRNRGMSERQQIPEQKYRPILSEDGLSELAKMIPSGTTVLDFYFCNRINEEICPDRYYGVFVISKQDGKPVVDFIRLGNATDIDYWVMRMQPKPDDGFVSRGVDTNEDGDLHAASNYIRQHVWDKIAGSISDDCEQLVICGDLTMGRVAWPLITVNDKQEFANKKKHLISAFPSSRDYFISQKHAKPTPRLRGLSIGSIGYGVPKQDTNGFEHLQSSVEEMELFSKYCRSQGFGVSEILGDEVVKSQVEDNLQKASIALISGHFDYTTGHRVNGLVKDPWQTCYLPLSGFNERGLECEESHLKAQDILELNLRNLDLVILSGCGTASGNRVPGDGIVSFQRAFLAAGTKSVLACKWPVQDRYAKLFVEEFLNQLAMGSNKGQALQQTQMMTRKNGWPESASAGWSLMGQNEIMIKNY